MFGFVPEISCLDEKHTEYAVGFNPSMTYDVDDKIPTSASSFTGKFGTLFKKGNIGFGVEIYKTKNISSIKDLVEFNTVNLKEYKKVFNLLDEGQEYIVKVSSVSTYRELFTCYKEAVMTNKIYTAQSKNVFGKELVCKPYLCLPLFTKSSWKFVFITNVARGIVLSSALGFFGRTLHRINKQAMYNDLSQACDRLWHLGYTHNDLHPNNIFYDPKSRKVTFIDLETSVEVLPEIKDKYVQKQMETEAVDCFVTFNLVMLEPALHMLRHSEKWLNEFSEKKPGECRVLHNIDSAFLMKVRDILQ
jgi:serine/threonine protein kinase